MRMLYCTVRDSRDNLWRVYIVDGWVMVEDEKCASGHRRCYGATDFDRREIELTIRQSWRTFKKTFLHELGHAAIGVDRPEKWDRKQEEKIMCRAEGSLLRMTQQLGLRVPPLPPGVKLRPQPRAKKVFA